MQMLDTNIQKQVVFLRTLSEIAFSGRYFSVSTDKAANPTSFMGATKRVMEHIIFDNQLNENLHCNKSSCRFANVAFSNGSLLQSFENRMRFNQPWRRPKTRSAILSLLKNRDSFA